MTNTILKSEGNKTTAARGDCVMPPETLTDSFDADRDLLQRVKNFICQRGYGPHRTLEIAVERGVVVVQGRVPTFYLRQIAVECVKRVAGVIHVIDRIEVGNDPRQPTENADDKRESLAAATLESVDLPDMARAAQDTHRPQIRNRHRLSSAKG